MDTYSDIKYIENKRKTKEKFLYASAQITLTNVNDGLDGDSADSYDGSFMQGKDMWSESQKSFAAIGTNVKVVKSSQSIYGKNILEFSQKTSGISEQWVYAKNEIPIEKDKIYKLTFRVRMTTDKISGGANVYAGATPFNESGVAIGTDGANNMYFVASSQSITVANGWKEYTGYISTSAKPALVDNKNQTLFPAVKSWPATSKTFKPMFIVNYKEGNGVAEVDGLMMEEVSVQYEYIRNLINKLDDDWQSVFDTLTSDGKMQGVFLDEKGHLYINGQYINAKKLSVESSRVDNTGKPIKTLEVHNDGEVSLNVKNFTLTSGGTSNVATDEDIDNIKVGNRNYVLRTGEKKTYTGTNSSNQTYNIGSFSIPEDLYNKEIVTTFKYKITSSTVAGTLRLQTATGSYHSLSDYITLKTGGTYTCTSKHKLGTNFTYVSARFDNFVGSIEITELKIEIGNKQTDWSPAPEDIDNKFNTVTNNISTIQQDMSKINLTVGKVEEVTNTMANPMRLGIKVNYSSFDNKNDGEIFIHGIDENGKPSNIDGYCIWEKNRVTLPKKMFNPNGAWPLKTTIYMVRDKSANQWIVVWKEDNTWKKCDSDVATNNTISTHTWSSSNHIVVGYLIISESETTTTEQPIITGMLFDSALTWEQATNMSLSVSYSQVELLEDELSLKVEKDGVISSINMYTQKDENGNNQSGVQIQADKINLNGAVTFSSLNKNKDELGDLFTDDENNKTVIDGGKILTNSVTAEKMDMYSLNVYRKGSVINNLQSGIYNIKIGKKTIPIKLEMNLHGGNWVRVFYHKVNGNGNTPVLFSNANNWAEAKLTNEKYPEGENKYSILSLLEEDIFKFKDTDNVNKFEFMLRYPKKSESAKNIWLQSSLPYADSVTHYKAISTSWTVNGWGGLAKSSANFTFIDGSPNSNTWHYAIGSNTAYPNSTSLTIPGPDTYESEVEIYVRLKDLSKIVDTSIPTFQVSNDGLIRASGTFKSFNFKNDVDISKTEGWMISEEGDSIFNNTIVRGRVELPSAGITDHDRPNLLSYTNFDKDVSSKYATWGNSGQIKYYKDEEGGYLNYRNTTLNVDDGYVGMKTAKVTQSLISGKTYTLSFKARSASNTGVLDYIFLLSNESGVSNYRIIDSVKINAYNSWSERQVITFKSNRDYPQASFLIGFKDEVITDNTNTKGFAIKELKLEEGDYPTIFLSDEEAPIRFYAGSIYEKRKEAAFKVLQDGTIIAKRGEFGGTFTGSIEIGNITISDEIGTTDKPGVGVFEIKNDNNTEVKIRIAEDENIFKSDIYFGGKDNYPIKYEYSSSKSNNKMIFNESSLLLNKTNNGKTDSISLTGTSINMTNSTIITKEGEDIVISTNRTKGTLTFKSTASNGVMDLKVTGDTHTKDLYLKRVKILNVEGDNPGIDFFIE